MISLAKSNIRKLGFTSFLIASFLGAFNDNCFKLLLTCCAMKQLPISSQNTYIPLAGMLFALPFLICSGYAGWLTDRLRTSTVLILTKWLELLVMLIGLLLFKLNALWILLMVLFFMGAQSAFYSPAKNSFLPETLRKDELSTGNALTQMFTFLAIIAGTWAGSRVASVHNENWWIGSIYCVAVAAIGVAASYFTTSTNKSTPTTLFKINPFGSHWATWKIIRKSPVLHLSLFGNTYFWFLGALYQNNLPQYVRYVLKRNDNTVIGYMLGAVGLGIGMGAMLCSMLSGKKIGYHLVIPSGIMMALLCLASGVHFNSLLPPIIISTLLGITAGMYQLPLSTSLQKSCPEKVRGSCLAFANAVDCISMILAYTLQWLLLKPLHCGAGGVFIVLGIITLLVMILLNKKAPFMLKRTRIFSFTKQR